MKQKPLLLTEEEILKLEAIVRKGKDWPSWDRAQTFYERRQQ
ncbi:hypothetical protein [Pseudomonas sp.]|nr:hypothetical protein [Pseudomonas sp.]